MLCSDRNFCFRSKLSSMSFTPTFYPIILPEEGKNYTNFTKNVWFLWHFSVRNSPEPPRVHSLERIAMRKFMEHPKLSKRYCSNLPQCIRREIVRYCLERKLIQKVIPFLQTWSEPVLSLRSLFPDLVYGPSLRKLY